jgi:predicted nucleotidyltransferase
MKACGLVVEYNPFHHGHQYHVDKARQETNADVIVAVMSGNFLQRGEPAIIDKWQRAQAALQNGVDLVVELPSAWAVQSADFFAAGAIRILQNLQCDSLCFGTDAKQPFDYAKFAQFEKENQRMIDDAFQRIARQNATYSQKMSMVLSELYPEYHAEKDQPNHLLGMAYAREVLCYEKPMRLVPIQRIAASYHSEQFKHPTIASATAIRQGLKQGEAVVDFVPEATQKFLSQTTVDWEAFWPYLQYQIISAPLEKLAAIYQMEEGLEYRLKQYVTAADSFADFIKLLKTKRYTQTRLQRLACYVLFQVTKAEMREAQAHPFIRVLGYTKQGQQYLKEVKKELTLPLIAKFGKKEAQRYGLSLRIDQIYQQGNAQISEQNFRRIPLFIDK